MKICKSDSIAGVVAVKNIEVALRVVGLNTIYKLFARWQQLLFRGYNGDYIEFVLCNIIIG